MITGFMNRMVMICDFTSAIGYPKSDIGQIASLPEDRDTDTREGAEPVALLISFILS